MTAAVTPYQVQSIFNCFFFCSDPCALLLSPRLKDESSYKKDDSSASGVSSQGLYPDGLTPPTKNVVRRRFLKARPDQGKFDRNEVRGRRRRGETKL